MVAQIKSRVSERLHTAKFLKQLGSSNNTSKTRVQSLNPKSLENSFCVITKGVVIKVTSIPEEKVFDHQFVACENEDDSLSNFYHNEEFGFKSTGLDIYLLEKLDEEKQSWPLSVLDTCIKCIVLTFPDDEESMIRAKHLSMPLLHQRPVRTGPY